MVWRTIDKDRLKNLCTLPNVNEDGCIERSLSGVLWTIVCSSIHSHATWSFAACSLVLKGLNLTVTTILSSLAAFGPPGVDAGVRFTRDAGVDTGVDAADDLSIFEFGVEGHFTVIVLRWFCILIVNWKMAGVFIPSKSTDFHQM